jgi:hypothetical protein
MKSADLLAEFRQAAEAVEGRHLDRLAALGVSLSIIDGLFDDDMPAPLGIKTGWVEDGLFIPGDGSPHIVQPIAVDGEMIDYVAWRSESPDDWHLRSGDGTFLGDVDLAVDACLWGEPAYVVPCPLDWLRIAGRGLCVVNWANREVLELNRLPSVVVPDSDLAADLRAALTRPPSIPVISISGELRNAA